MSKLILVWISTLLAVLYVGWILCAETTKVSPQGQISPFNAILQGNSLISISPIEFPHIQVLASKIVECESGWNNWAVGKAGERGIAQFKQKTFEWMSELSGMEGDWLNEDDQWNLLLWALENNLESHWTCYRLVK